MAARGIKAGEVRCLVLLPSQMLEPWMAVLTEATALRGWTLSAHASGQPVPYDPATILVVTDPADLEGVSPGQIAVIATGLNEAAGAMAHRYVLPPEQGIWVASRLLAQATCIPNARWIGDRDPADGPVEVLPGLMVTPPPLKTAAPGDALALASAEALRLLAEGPPSAGASTWWRPALFTYDRRQADLNPDVAEIDITGRPRILVSGPYVSLPPGRWRIRLRFTVDRDAATAAYRIEWGDSSSCSVHEFLPGQAGRFEVELDHDWTRPDAAQVRFILQQGAFHGLLGFHGLSIELTG